MADFSEGGASTFYSTVKDDIIPPSFDLKFTALYNYKRRLDLKAYKMVTISENLNYRKLNKQLKKPYLSILVWKNHIFVWKNHILVWKNHIFVWKNYILVWKNHILVWKNNILVWKNHILVWKIYILVWKNHILVWKNHILVCQLFAF